MANLEGFINYHIANIPASIAAIFDDNISIVEYQSKLFIEARNEALEMAKWLGKTSKCLLDVNEAVGDQLPDFLNTYPITRAALSHQIELLCDVTGCQQVGLRFAVLNTPMCPAFHIDQVQVRFVWTLYGESTEFLVTTQHGCESRVAGPIRGQPGSLIILKGTRWGKSEQDAAWHRSPPVNDVRVIFTLDAL